MDLSFESTRRFNNNVIIGYRDMLVSHLTNPRMTGFLLRTILRFMAAQHKRDAWAKQGVRVPPMLIYSVTKNCNLSCKGCYAKVLHTSQNRDLSPAKFTALVDEADRIGVSIMMLAGGEPLMRRELLDVTAKHPRVIFPVFTNGLMLDGERFEQLKRQKHVIPILSLEGNALETNARRGEGVFENAKSLIERLRRNHHLFGISLTVTRGNFAIVTSKEYVETLVRLGSKVIFFINYVPVEMGTEDQRLTRPQIDALVGILDGYRREYPALFVGFPSGEEEFGGCLAAGKGFVHINAEGDVQPCPFSPYTDANVDHMPLIEALKSPLLVKVRENNTEDAESNGVCELWQKREWVASLERDNP
jgi:MoaA/NifB/PqqE/SkfB family radical SAM enzyme